MADGSARSVAEKLAAAKKKHKAYLKEKILKSKGNNIQDAHFTDTVNQPHSTHLNANTKLDWTEPSSADVNETKDLDTTLEPDFPLPQYSMDYNSQLQTSSLPDPLSFFDNFSSVGATFQNLAQPLASFFNNSTNLPVDDLVELPNQICVDESNAYSDCKSLNINSIPEKNDQIFSYENFKSNAISNIPRDNKNLELKGNFENEHLPRNQNYDHFADNSNAIKNEESFKLIQEYPSNTLNNKLHNDVSNDDSENISSQVDSFQICQENMHIAFEVTPEIVAYVTEDDTNINSESNQIKENNELLQTDNSQNEIQYSNIQVQEKKPDGTEEFIKDGQKLLDSSDVTLYPDYLYKRNKELQELLESQNVCYASLTSQLQESEIKYSKLLSDFETLKIQKEDNEESLRTDGEMQNDLSKLRNELQCHLQTIGLLVAEKTELSASLNNTQLSLENEISNNLELKEKMERMKEFSSNLEKELESIKLEKNSLYGSHKEQMTMLNNTQESYNKLKNEHDEVVQDLLESKEQFKSVTERNKNLENDINELRGQLSLANIKIQQLTLDEAAVQENQLHKLMQEKFEFQKQISFLNDTLKSISKEREESDVQYQQYAEQLNAQIRNLDGKIDYYQKENEQLRIQEENRIKHIGDLEKQLQTIQNDNNTFNSQRSINMLKREIETVMETTEQLQAQKDDLNASLTKALIEKELLQKDLDSCKFSINQLESTVEQLRGSQPDNAVLLATMESDKVAASRAIAQNNELKRQMEGMQEVLLKVNNDNVQLTENVSLERKTNKELFEKLQRTEISLQTLTEAIEIKDKELINLREKLEMINRQEVHQEHIYDRLRHYEAQDHSSSLQKELQDAKHMISHLTNELNILKQNQLNQTNQINQIDICQTHEVAQIGQTLSLDEKVSETSSTVSDLKSQLITLQMRNSELESLLQNLRTDFLRNESKRIDANGNESLDKETAMRHLEKKFLRTMEEIARLTEEKQRLEHLVLQLQGETETIGEYVSLYQQQRSILKQRALEKDQQLQQLTNDRETIKANLDRLNSLVNKLILEKGAITKELMEQHEHFNREHDDLCDEHQKIHQEINKITGDGFRNSGISDSANTEVAAEIMSLLSEIKSSNLVQPAEDIHHCPWCSGKLITV
ncbi:hypothetical protein WA026_022066 [Henosepilachna vigintioctopunctata]|uniref:Golgin subfamily A conserved domain-containing protein n=1 Tax=Henosepilachna vigintioctopunctata TaxID=420089 RepID=A0AAW1U3R7_9CUCU